MNKGQDTVGCIPPKEQPEFHRILQEQYDQLSEQRQILLLIEGKMRDLLYKGDEVQKECLAECKINPSVNDIVSGQKSVVSGMQEVSYRLNEVLIHLQQIV